MDGERSSVVPAVRAPGDGSGNWAMRFDEMRYVYADPIAIAIDVWVGVVRVFLFFSVCIVRMCVCVCVCLLP